MKRRRFVIMAEPLPADVANAITNDLTSRKLGVWKWVDNVWLVNDFAETTAKSLYDSLASVPGVAGNDMLVLRVDSDSGDYWGNLPKKAWVWFNPEWHP